MNLILLFSMLGLSSQVTAEKSKHWVTNKTHHHASKNLKNLSVNVAKESELKPKVIKDNITVTSSHTVQKVKFPSVEKKEPEPIKPELLQSWANEISQTLYNVEKLVRRDSLMSSFKDHKMTFRDGKVIVDKMVKDLENLLNERGRAAENIMRKAESLAEYQTKAPSSYKFDQSNFLNVLKTEPTLDPHIPKMLPINCTNLGKVSLYNQTHFDPTAEVSLDVTSVQFAAEVYPCDERVINEIYWTEELQPVFRQNYAQDVSIGFQYFCSMKGFLRHYPGALWSSMFRLSLNPEEDEDEPGDVYDCRLRPWYVAASGAPRDVVILMDASGSMYNSSNKVIAEMFTLALLSALTDDDQVNVLRYNFNVDIEYPISCFKDKLVSANHVNSAALMSALKYCKLINESDTFLALRESVNLLRKQNSIPGRPPSCQQVIILITDSVERNYTEYFGLLDPDRQFRLVVIWLHDINGIRDNTKEMADWLSCSTDGYFTELITHADVTEQVMRILRLLERPLVSQRIQRPMVFSDAYAHIEDPRRSEYFWHLKENEEQAYRYKLLRQNKKKLLSNDQRYKDFMRFESLNNYGHYYEGQDWDYRLQISVSVPVFEATTSENITIKLFEEKERNSTRTYPVNRLLGVAGVDIPLEQLKMILPYHQLGAGGSLFLVNHRGNIIIHDNLKPTFNGDILRPGYRTVDLLELEQPGLDLPPRDYSKEWLDFREAVVIDQPIGNKTMFSKYIYEDGMRAILENREYHWRRVLDHYTAVVGLPVYNRKHVLLEGAFTQQLADSAYDNFRTELTVHPDWLYCRHIDQHFDNRESEVLHFIRRRKDEPDFPMQKLKHVFLPIKYEPLVDKPYKCNEELMVRLCKDVMATAKWIDVEPECDGCELGSITTFFASENGLTRWLEYHATTSHADPPAGNLWPRGPTESWYRLATTNAGTLVVHAPVTPYRRLRNTDAFPPPLTDRHMWLTAARTLGSTDGGIIGVAGYHFYPKHLEDVLKSVTQFFADCEDEDGNECEPRCDGKYWSCIIIDEEGWIVAGNWREEDERHPEDPIRNHLAQMYPHAMNALLESNIFKLHWIHDYQGVCFPPEVEILPSPASIMPSILRSLAQSIYVLYRVTSEIIYVLSIICSGSLVAGETQKDKEKRRRHLKKDIARENYENLYDDLVLVNRTRIAACDRSRPFYSIKKTPQALKALKTMPNPCKWPLVGTYIPKTNLILLAIYNLCNYNGRPLPDPFNNEPVKMDLDSDVDWTQQTKASKLACWRHRVPLPARAPPTTCFPHNFSFEEGYRQCGPWLPDPEPESESSSRQLYPGIISTLALLFTFI